MISVPYGSSYESADPSADPGGGVVNKMTALDPFSLISHLLTANAGSVGKRNNQQIKEETSMVKSAI